MFNSSKYQGQNMTECMHDGIFAWCYDTVFSVICFPIQKALLDHD